MSEQVTHGVVLCSAITTRTGSAAATGASGIARARVAAPAMERKRRHEAIHSLGQACQRC
jgi:hypothetical protein